MRQRRIISTARGALHDLRSDLHGVQLDTDIPEVAAEIAAARDDMERAMGRLTDVLRTMELDA